MDIIIDYRIRDWVFIPLILVMFLVNLSIFRLLFIVSSQEFYVSILINTKKTQHQKKK